MSDSFLSEVEESSDIMNSEMAAWERERLEYEGRGDLGDIHNTSSALLRTDVEEEIVVNEHEVMAASGQSDHLFDSKLTTREIEIMYLLKGQVSMLDVNQ